MNTSYGITSKSQVTIPHEVRKKLDLSTDDRVAFTVEDGRAYITKVPTLEEVSRKMQADLKRRGFNRTVSQKEIDTARDKFIREGMTWE
jgi:AbrB family looped-hinge helix DNA binding protein